MLKSLLKVKSSKVDGRFLRLTVQARHTVVWCCSDVGVTSGRVCDRQVISMSLIVILYFYPASLFILALASLSLVKLMSSLMQTCF